MTALTTSEEKKRREQPALIRKIGMTKHLPLTTDGCNRAPEYLEIEVARLQYQVSRLLRDKKGASSALTALLKARVHFKDQYGIAPEEARL